MDRNTPNTKPSASSNVLTSDTCFEQGYACAYVFTPEGESCADCGRSRSAQPALRTKPIVDSLVFAATPQGGRPRTTVAPDTRTEEIAVFDFGVLERLLSKDPAAALRVLTDLIEQKGFKLWLRNAMPIGGNELYDRIRLTLDLVVPLVRKRGAGEYRREM